MRELWRHKKSELPLMKRLLGLYFVMHGSYNNLEKKKKEKDLPVLLLYGSCDILLLAFKKTVASLD